MKTIFILLLSFFALLTFQNVIYLNPGCKSFDQDGNCEECSVRFYEDDKGICQPVNSNCNTYHMKTGACLTCYPGFAIVEDTCLPEALVSAVYDPNCNKFEGSSCVKCSFGYYFNFQGKCTLANPSCKTFDESNGFCTSCYPGFEVEGPDCVKEKEKRRDPNCNQFINGQCVKCSFGFYFNSERECMKVPVDCASFDYTNLRCAGCYTGYELNFNYECVESEQPEGDPNCNEFIDGVCQKCSFGFYFNDERTCTKVPDDCLNFSIEKRRCERCYNGYELNSALECIKSELGVSDPNCNEFIDGVCQKCSFGYYFDEERVCQKIPDDCLDFRIDEKRCYQCYSGYKLNENFECVESQQEISDIYCNKFEDGVCVRCSFGYYFNQQKKCVQAPDQCKNYDTVTQQCKECYPGYILNVNKTCSSSPEDVTDKYCKQWLNNTCLQCSQGSFLTKDNFCKLVDPLCKTHSSTDGNCTSCFPGYSVDDGACVPSGADDLDPNCKQFLEGICLQCSYRFYMNNRGVCESVSPICKTYNELNGACNSCFVGFKVEGTTCVEDQDVIDDPNCAKWRDGRCEECSFGAFFSSNGKCELVDLLCRTYNQSDGSCLSCYPAFRLQDKKCIEDIGFESQDPYCSEFLEGVCLKCSKGFYFGADGLCTKISDQCQEYSDQTGQCFSCYLGFKLDENSLTCVEDKAIQTDKNCAQFSNGQCIKCFERFYLSGFNQCDQVDIFCKDYDGNTGACLSCYDLLGFVLENGKCIK